MDIDHEATNQVPGFQEIRYENNRDEYSPSVIAWNNFLEEIDWEKIAVTIWLFLSCFLLLSPDIWNWRIWQGRKRCEKGERIQVHPGSPSVTKQRTPAVSDDKVESVRVLTSSSTTVCTGVIGEEEETEEKPSKSKKASKKEDDDDDDVEVKDDWEKGEEADNWDPDFDEFDVPKSKEKKAGTKKPSKDEDDFKVDDDFKEMGLFDDMGGDDDDDDF